MRGGVGTGTFRRNSWLEKILITFGKSVIGLAHNILLLRIRILDLRRHYSERGGCKVHSAKISVSLNIQQALELKNGHTHDGISVGRFAVDTFHDQSR
jgi:hypothetical protein